MDALLKRPRHFRGILQVPGDKSISHRVALIGALAEGVTEAENFSFGGDCQSTLECLKELGIRVEIADGAVRIYGRGLRGFTPSARTLDAGNSGTTLRLLSGILAGQRFESVITGDSSLVQRPMRRIIEPLRLMGATVEAAAGDTAPLRIQGGALRSIDYRLPVPSAQVKSCILLAGLYADGVTTVMESVPTRDHTERQLPVEIERLRNGTTAIRIRGGATLDARRVRIPGDISSAAFFLVAGALIPGADITVRNVGLNPTRMEVIHLLRKMGADLEISPTSVSGGEPVGDLRVRACALRGTTLEGATVAQVIDEIPILAVAGACAQGGFAVRGARELRYKETDRIAALVVNLRKMGVKVIEFDDGFSIEGGNLKGAELQSFGDHRIAMALAIAGLLAEGETVVRGAECAQISFPGFWDALAALQD